MINNENGDLGLLMLILLLLGIVIVGVSLDSLLLAKISPKLTDHGNSASNGTMNLAVSRGWSAIDLAGLGLPILTSIGGIIFIILVLRNPSGGQPQ